MFNCKSVYQIVGEKGIKGIPETGFISFDQFFEFFEVDGKHPGWLTSLDTTDLVHMTALLLDESKLSNENVFVHVKKKLKLTILVFSVEGAFSIQNVIDIMESLILLDDQFILFIVDELAAFQECVELMDVHRFGIDLIEQRFLFTGEAVEMLEIEQSEHVEGIDDDEEDVIVNCYHQGRLYPVSVEHYCIA